MLMQLRSKRRRPDNDQPHCSKSTLPSPSTTTHHRGPNIQALPDEILLLVLQHLPTAHLLSTVPRVCHHWRSLHTDPSLYTRLVFSAAQPAASTEAAARLIKMAPWLRSLRVSHRNDVETLLRHVAESDAARHLEHLVLRRCTGANGRSHLPSHWLRKVLTQCGAHLRHLSLKYTLCNGGEFYRDIGPLLRALKTIDLGSSKWITATVLASIVAHCRGIEEFRAYPVAKLPGAAVAELCDRYRDSLRVLKVTCHCPEAVMSSLARCRRLHTLHLYNADRLANASLLLLAVLPRLVNLTISYAKAVTTECWLEYFRGAPARRLEKLTLHACPHVDDAVVGVVVDNLRGLRVLRFMRCAVTAGCGLGVQGSVPGECLYWYV